MPRVSEAKPLSRTQFYHTEFDSSPAIGDYTPRPASPASSASSTTAKSTKASGSQQEKKKHICPTCERGFTTSGHLARHSRVHTGERQHKCPFPGCETACSRQDNLQQHYRIHLSPGSRRSSARSAISRAMNSTSRRVVSQHHISIDPTTPPLSCPPALEQARVYYAVSPPNSPPALTQATLPATATIFTSSHSRGPSSSPQANYALHLHQLPVASPMPLSESSYGPFTPSPIGYHSHADFPFPQEEKHDPYAHASPYAYPEQASYPIPSIPNIKTSVERADRNAHDSPLSATSVGSRHSLSHISHPNQSYSRTTSSVGTAPSSPASSRSVSSHASNGPATPTYTLDDYQHGGNILAADHPSGPTPNSVHSNHHIGYHGIEFGHSSRCESSSPELSHPEDSRVGHYVHHQPSAYGSYSPQYPPMHVRHAPWKSGDGRARGLDSSNS